MTLVMSIRNVPAGAPRNFPVAPAVYKPVKKPNGVVVWRLEEKCLFGTLTGGDGTERERGFYTAKRALEESYKLASHRGLEFVEGLFNGAVMADWEIDRYAPELRN